LPLVATTGSTKAPSFVAKEDDIRRRETVLASGGGAGLTRQLPGSGADVGEEDLSDARGLFQSREVSSVVERH
jgi:hypothetical protein